MNYENVDTELSLKMHKLPSVGPFVCVCVSGGGGGRVLFLGRGGGRVHFAQRCTNYPLSVLLCVCVGGGGGRVLFFGRGGGGGRVHFAQGTT